MRKVIDMYLDLPTDKEYLVRTLSQYCLGEGKTHYAGYKKSYGPKIAEQIGMTIEELDHIAETQGDKAFLDTVEAAADKAVMTMDTFFEKLDEWGVVYGMTASHDHDNDKTAEIVAKYPDRLGGFGYVDPKDPMAAVREVERCVKELGLKAIYSTAFRTMLPANDKKFYPVYAKCIELDVPVFIYSSMNLSAAVPHDIGHPRYIDEIARDFPELRIMATVGGWPWVHEFLGLALRHKNIYINFEVHQPVQMVTTGWGMEGYLYFGGRSLSERMTFASNWNVQGASLPGLIQQVEDLPLSDEVKNRWLYENAKTFLRT